MRTVYDVVVNYGLESKGALASANNVSNAFTKAAKSAKLLEANTHAANNTLTKAFRWVGLAYLAYNAFEKMSQGFLKYNQEMEDAATTMATTMFGFKAVGSFEDGIKRSQIAIKEYAKAAAEGVGSTKDYIEMHQALQGQVMTAGGSMETLKRLTVGATVATSAFGVNTQYLSQDIGTMITGNVQNRDRFARRLIEMQFRALNMEGKTYDDYNKMVKSGEINAVQFTEAALTSPAMKAAQERYKESFSGRLDQLKDNITRGMAAAGKPLFDAISVQMDKINRWIANNQVKIAQWAKSFGEALVRGAELLRGAIEIIIENAGLLLSIGKVWLTAALAFKAAAKFGALSGGIKSLIAGPGAAGAVAGGFDSLGMPIGGQLRKGKWSDKFKNSPIAQRAGGSNPISMEGQAMLIAGAGMAGYEFGSFLRDRASLFRGDVRPGENTLGERIGGSLAVGVTNIAQAFGALEGTYENYAALLRQERNLRQASMKAEEEASRQTGILSTTIAKSIFELKHLRELNAPGTAGANSGGIRDLIGGGPAFSNVFKRLGIKGRLQETALLGFAKREFLSEEDIKKKGLKGVYAGEQASSADIAIKKLMGMTKDALSTTENEQLIATAFHQLIGEALSSGTFRIPTSEEAAKRGFELGMLRKETRDTILARTDEAQNAIKGTGKTSITIQRIQVETPDAERLVYDMETAFRDAVRSPSQARDILTGMGKRR